MVPRQPTVSSKEITTDSTTLEPHRNLAIRPVQSGSSCMRRERRVRTTTTQEAATVNVIANRSINGTVRPVGWRAP